MDTTRLQYYITLGMSTHKIAKEENCSATNVKYWLKKYGLTTRKIKPNQYSDQDIITFASQVKTLSQLLIKLNLNPRGRNFDSIKAKLQKLQVDTSHWTGQGWSKNQQLKDWSQYNSPHHIRKLLIKEREAKCEKCKISHWFDIPITIEMHHIDGDRLNNNRNNLQLLCPNCHSITDTFKSRNRK